jgi:hypothetical protein
MLYYSLSLIIGQDQYDAYHQRSQRVQNSASPNVNQDPYRQQQQQQYQGLIEDI